MTDKEFDALKQHDWYVRNRERVIGKQKAYYDKHREKYKAYMKEYYASHKEQYKAYRKSKRTGPRKRRALMEARYYMHRKRIIKILNKYEERFGLADLQDRMILWKFYLSAYSTAEGVNLWQCISH